MLEITSPFPFSEASCRRLEQLFNHEPTTCTTKQAAREDHTTTRPRAACSEQPAEEENPAEPRDGGGGALVQPPRRPAVIVPPARAVRVARVPQRLGARVGAPEGGMWRGVPCGRARTHALAVRKNTVRVPHAFRRLEAGVVPPVVLFRPPAHVWWRRREGRAYDVAGRARKEVSPAGGEVGHVGVVQVRGARRHGRGVQRRLHDMYVRKGVGGGVGDG